MSQRKFLNVSQELIKPGQFTDDDKFIIYQPDKNQLKRHFNSAMQTNPEMAELNKQIRAETESIIQKYFNGDASEGELAERFQGLAQTFFNACEEKGLTFYLNDASVDKSMMEAFYSEFRFKILSIAVQKNNEEGKKYITGKLNAQRDWKYYNSKYYYESESAISAITDAMGDIARERGHTEFSVPDYKGEKLWLYNNFNSALSNPFVVTDKYILDPDVVPPKDFEWFYQSGGDSANKIVTPDCVIATDRYGNEVCTVLKSTTKFDPTDPNTATMWARYKDSDGKLHSLSTDLFYKHSKNDLYAVGDLLRFTDGSSTSDVNMFLGNLQVYEKGYFERLLKCSPASKTYLN